MVFPVQHEIASGKKRPRNDSLNSYDLFTKNIRVIRAISEICDKKESFQGDLYGSKCRKRCGRQPPENPDSC
jgi:hypothetical protein